jgi:hypothetical protein
MLKRIVVKESKPKDWMMRGPKVDMPPLGILFYEGLVLIMAVERWKDLKLTRW